MDMVRELAITTTARLRRPQLVAGTISKRQSGVDVSAPN